MTERTWSYREITQQTEASITSLLKEAKQEPEKKHISHIWAYGIYLGWSHFTLGYQDASDAARLEKLALGSFSPR